jgi:hypothetical protein
MSDVLDWLFALERNDVQWGLAAIGLLANAASIVSLHGKVAKLRAELEQRGVV